MKEYLKCSALKKHQKECCKKNVLTCYNIPLKYLLFYFHICNILYLCVIIIGTPENSYNKNTF